MHQARRAHLVAGVAAQLCVTLALLCSPKHEMLRVWRLTLDEASLSAACLQDASAHFGRALLAQIDDVYAPAPAPPSTDVCDEKCQIQVRCRAAFCQTSTQTLL